MTKIPKLRIFLRLVIKQRGVWTNSQKALILQHISTKSTAPWVSLLWYVKSLKGSWKRPFSRAISTCQHGFLPRQSCLSNVLVFEDAVTRMMDEGHTVNSSTIILLRPLTPSITNSFGETEVLWSWWCRCSVDWNIPFWTGRDSTLWLRTLGGHSNAHWCSTGLRDRPTLGSSFRERPPGCPRSTDAALCGWNETYLSILPCASISQLGEKFPWDCLFLPPKERVGIFGEGCEILI